MGKMLLIPSVRTKGSFSSAVYARLCWPRERVFAYWLLDIVW